MSICRVASLHSKIKAASLAVTVAINFASASAEIGAIGVLNRRR